MSVAPDLLLKSAPEVKPKASAAKAPAKPAEPSKSGAASFAQVYAKERQAKSAERSDASAKPNCDKTSEPDREEDPGAVATAGEPVLAESGNPLPTDPAQLDPALDPLLLMVMAGQQPATEVEVAVNAEAEAGGEGELGLPTVLSSLASSGHASMTEASHDPELDALNELPAVKMALELGAKAQAAAQQQAAPNATATQTALSAGQNFANALAAFADPTVLNGEAKAETELPLSELATEGLDALKESPSDARADNFASKLGALSQSVAQPATQSQRAALIPGQPVPMQQGGWSEAVVDRVMWLSSQNLKSAEIQLDPAELGRLEVRINLHQDQAQVTFASPNAGVRDALEGQMHRLRELFAQQGMNMLDVNVSDQSLNRGWQGQGGDAQSRGGAGRDRLSSADDDAPLPASEVRSTMLTHGRGLVDYYA
ncbi:flagellar hook-length control protein FliK [Pseudomonas cavernicola]|uniref:Flagellar hook-length control protein FliK n=1 Tax=Pseudomonas cavernicola TaxID=2320866 RepID=A0A418XBG0_9PSED|nr:flagellar hook-length control protein FliK [Pseudomonas cavernicola]RJG09846.1 flagellar hook-length control protein FliK [Pseudomonas cavernicola]